MTKDKLITIRVRISSIQSTTSDELIKVTLQFNDGEEKVVNGFKDQLPHNIAELIDNQHIFEIEIIKTTFSDKKYQATYCINAIKV